MSVIVAHLVLLALVGAVIFNLVAPSPSTAVFAGHWLPVDNGQLEGWLDQ